jgi:hypothetical protein
MRNFIIMIAMLVLILATAVLSAEMSQIKIPVYLDNITKASPPQYSSTFSYCPAFFRGWSYYKFGRHSFGSTTISRVQIRPNRGNLFKFASGIKNWGIVTNAILDYDDYTHIDKFFENKE